VPPVVCPEAMRLPPNRQNAKKDGRDTEHIPAADYRRHPFAGLSCSSEFVFEEFPAVLGGGAEFLVNPQELVVFADAICPGRCARLDLADAGCDGEVGDRGVFGLAAAVAHDGSVAVAMSQVDRFKRLGERADLVDLDEDRIGAAHFDALGQALGVGDKKVVANELALAADFLSNGSPAVPIVFGEAVLDADLAQWAAIASEETDFFGADLKNL